MSKKRKAMKAIVAIRDSVGAIRPVDNDEDMKKAYKDTYITEQQKIRDKHVTELLKHYVDGYESKTNSNKIYKMVIFIVCISIIVLFSGIFSYLMITFDYNMDAKNVESIVALISICITFLTLIVGILKIITEYSFPAKEEEYITRIVEIIQKNDLENKKQIIKVINGMEEDNIDEEEI